MRSREQEPFDYSTRIISPVGTEYEPTGEEQVTIDIVGDKVLGYDGKEASIRPDALAINGLLLLRHMGWVRPGEIKDTVGTDLSAPALADRFHKLSAAVEAIAEFPNAVERQGTNQNTQVRLSPLLAFRDIRETLDENGLIGEWKDEYGIPRLKFATPEDRQRALSDLFKRNSNSRQVALHSARLQVQRIGKTQQDIELSPSDIYDLLVDIELGLYAHLHHSEDEEEAGIGATNAYHTLLTSVQPMLTGLATSRSWFRKEELIQEGLECIAKKIMDFTGNEDLHQVADGFYPLCLSFAGFRYSNFIVREMAVARSMSTRTYRLERSIREVQKDFTKEHGRMPTESEVHDKLDNPDVSLKRVKSVMFRLQQGSTLSMSYFEHEDAEWLPRSTFIEPIDEEIERTYREDMAEKVFVSDALTDKEKIILSLYHGKFTENLRGAELYKKVVKKEGGSTAVENVLVFTYPYDTESFESIAESAIGNLSALGSILDYTHKGVDRILKAAEKKAYIELEELVGDDTNF